MFQTTSMTGTGLIVLIVSIIVQMLGVVNVNDGDISRYVANGSEIVSFVLMVWGQARRSDLKWGLWRK